MGPRKITTIIALIAFMMVCLERSEARNRELLNQALAASNKERAGVETEYKRNDAAIRKQLPKSEVRTVTVELGDELGSPSRGKDGFKITEHERVFHEKAVSAKLDREWREVNKAVGDHGVRTGSTPKKKPVTPKKKK